MKIKKEKNAIAVIIGSMFFFLMVVILIQFKTISNTDITALELMEESELKTEIATINSKYEELLLKLEETNNTIKEYQETINTDKEASVLLKNDLEKSRDLLGKNAVAGPGVVITLTDVEVGKYGKITDTDLIELLNALKEAGAEAISINDHRIIINSYISDLTENSFISVNKNRLVSPYVVKAIGNITYLESGLSQKQYGYIDKKNNEGKDVKLEKSDYIVINAYEKEIKYEYAKEVEE